MTSELNSAERPPEGVDVDMSVAQSQHAHPSASQCPPTFSSLIHAALLEVCSRLDAKSLVALQLVTGEASRAATDEMIWR